MKPYEELTKRGKLRRLHSLSLKALEEYHLQVKRLKFLAVETITMFRVNAEDGERKEQLQWLFTAFGQKELMNSLRP